MIILASASKARRKLIKMCRRNTAFKRSDIDETRLDNEELFDYLQRITYLKALKFVSSRNTVISADTVIVFKEKMIGKPKNKKEAFDILSMLRGSCHYCFSAVTIFSPHIYEFFVDYAAVYMKPISNNQIYNYLDSEDFGSKAAGYAIQGSASEFMSVVKGDITTVIGLPMKKLCRII